MGRLGRFPRRWQDAQVPPGGVSLPATGEGGLQPRGVQGGGGARPVDNADPRDPDSRSRGPHEAGRYRRRLDDAVVPVLIEEVGSLVSLSADTREGAFEISDLPSGPSIVMAAADGFAPSWRTLTLEMGEQQ